MATETDLRAMREGLFKALGNGTLSVSAGGVTRTFRSVAELQAAIRAVDSELDEIGSGPVKTRFLKINAARGW